MKLVGSKAEKEFSEELIKSNKLLQDPRSLLRKVLENEGINTLNAYVLHYIYEQFEDLYVVLIDGEYLVEVEIDRVDSAVLPIVERRELKTYLHQLSKVNQIRLAVAQELVRERMTKGLAEQ